MSARLQIAILVIDDDESQCRRICETLSARRFDVVTFTHPDEALTHLRNLCCGDDAELSIRPRKSHSDSQVPANSVATQTPSRVSGVWRYALALVDLNMPGGAGPPLIKEIRRISPPTRVLALSAFPESAELLAAFRAGALDVIEKPIQAERLNAEIDRRLAEAGVIARDEDEFNRRLGARLRRIRLLSDRTIQEVAELAAITAAQISLIESGKSGTSTWTLARLCAALRIQLSTVFETDGPA